MDGVLGLSGCQANKLGASERKRSGDEDGAEAVEAIVEGKPVLPISAADVASVVSGNSSAIVNDGENAETNDGCAFDSAEDNLVT